jgi:hypothetical protein
MRPLPLTVIFPLASRTTSVPSPGALAAAYAAAGRVSRASTSMARRRRIGKTEYFLPKCCASDRIVRSF